MLCFSLLFSFHCHLRSLFPSLCVCLSSILRNGDNPLPALPVNPNPITITKQTPTWRIPHESDRSDNRRVIHDTPRYSLVIRRRVDKVTVSFVTGKPAAIGCEGRQQSSTLKQNTQRKSSLASLLLLLHGQQRVSRVERFQDLHFLREP